MLASVTLDEPITQPTTRSDRRRARTRDRLVDAAGEVFGRKGVDPTTIADLTETADVALGTFYNYFEGKDQIVDAVSDKAAGLLCTEVRSAADAHDDHAVKLAAVVHSVFDWYERESVWGPFMITIGLRNETLAREFGGLILQLVIDGEQAGRFRSRHAQMLPVTIAGTLVAALGYRHDGIIAAGAAEAVASHLLRASGIAAEEADEIASTITLSAAR